MGKRSKRDREDRDDDDRDEGEDEVDAEAARDFVMARLAAARTYAAEAVSQIDAALGHFVEPNFDKTGKDRVGCLDGADAGLGNAAIALQMARDAFNDVDTEAGEPEPDEDDDED